MFTDKAILKEKFICKCTCKKKKIIRSVPKPSILGNQTKKRKSDWKQAKEMIKNIAKTNETEKY